jgi:CubicO group peptidase (beta-lactamase class C family)
MIELNTVRDRLQAVIREQMDAGNIPGLALALTDRTRTLWVAADGYADLAARIPLTAEMLFAIGSIGKSFTSIALLQEHDAGNLDLDQPVTRYLPWFEVRSSYDPITIHHLLSHSSGLVSTFDFATSDWPHVLALRETEVTAPPGQHFSYSNDGYKTLGLVLRAVTGRSYGDVIRARILEPLGMHATDPVITQETRERLAVGHEPFYDDRPARRSDPLVRVNWFETDTADGCVAASAGDLAIYLRMLLNRGQGPLGRIVSEQSFARMSSRMIEAGPGQWYGYGLGTFEDDHHTIIGHGGGMPGFVSTMTADMDAGVGAVVLVNTAADPGSIAQYARQLLCAAVTGGSVPDAPIVSDSTIVEDAGEYEGAYVGDNASFELAAEDDRLLMAWKAEQLTLERRGLDAFLVPHSDFACFLLAFERQDGRVVAAWFGPDHYVGERYAGSSSKCAAPAAWSAYLGHYRSFSPWLSNFRVIVRQASLLLVFPAGGEALLIPAGEAQFKLGRWGGEIRFGSVIDGRAIEATLVTSKYYRVDTP